MKFTAIQEEFLQALESGEYKQCRGKICKVTPQGDHSYCVLGVACEVYNRRQKKHKKKQLRVTYNRDITRKYYDGILGGFLPLEVQMALQLLSAWGTIIRKSSHNKTIKTSLFKLNDNEKLTHQELAAYIRKYPHRVFRNFMRHITMREALQIIREKELWHLGVDGMSKVVCLESEPNPDILLKMDVALQIFGNDTTYTHCIPRKRNEQIVYVENTLILQGGEQYIEPLAIHTVDNNE